MITILQKQNLLWTIHIHWGEKKKTPPKDAHGSECCQKAGGGTCAICDATKGCFLESMTRMNQKAEVPFFFPVNPPAQQRHNITPGEQSQYDFCITNNFKSTSHLTFLRLHLIFSLDLFSKLWKHVMSSIPCPKKKKKEIEKIPLWY